QMGEMIQKDAICLGDNFDKISIKKRIARDPPDMLMMPVSVAATDFGAELSRQADNLGYRFWVHVELLQSSSGNFHLERWNTLDVLMPPPTPLTSLTNRVFKRLFDLALASLIVVMVLPPLIILVWFLHQLFSQGPLFFVQRRVGRNGKIFKVFKFRSLNVKNENESQQVAFDDDRFFKGGRFIRKFSIDEFPQFLNVLVGNMSLVGPRPHMEQHEKDFALLYEKYGLRRTIKPGITGLAQVKGLRGEVRGKIDIRHRARMDIFYIKNWSISLDSIIIIKTFKSIVFPPKSAY
ncbi:sugar transferase, partial [Akkermansiaceae bacterium]|nr:sugar transferase [Akkermansiaceae bacterium]